MPIYEYACPRCGIFEQWQSMTDAPLEICPKCSSPVKKLIGRNISVIYKASGFHTTDYRSKEYKEAEKKEKDSASTTKWDSKSSEAKAADGGV